MTVNPIFASNFTANVKILFYVRKEWVFQISKRQLWALHLACYNADMGMMVMLEMLSFD